MNRRCPKCGAQSLVYDNLDRQIECVLCAWYPKKRRKVKRGKV